MFFMNCRHCKTELTQTFLDLGFSPPSNAYLGKVDLFKPEYYYPLNIKVCDQCWLVQTEDYAQANDLFRSDYAYFSSTSSGWLLHAKNYVQKIISDLKLNSDSFIIEVASNDGYLLKNFLKAGIPCLGIEPTDSTAAAAEKIGVPVLREFFCDALAQSLASDGKQADLIIGNNVFAHVPDINDFTQGLKSALKKGGTITLEFPHLMRLIDNIQFDTVYHEHYSYLSIQTVIKIFQSAGLRVFRVEELTTHGGSLRIYGCHDNDNRSEHPSVLKILSLEKLHGLNKLCTYLNFQPKANKIKNDFINFLIEKKRAGKKICGYGAAAKGSTLLNYAGIKPDLLPFVADAAKSKHGKFMPGSHIPIHDPVDVNWHELDYVLILPWNIADEVKMYFRNNMKIDVSFVTAIPSLVIEK